MELCQVTNLTCLIWGTSYKRKVVQSSQNECVVLSAPHVHNCRGKDRIFYSREPQEMEEFLFLFAGCVPPAAPFVFTVLSNTPAGNAACNEIVNAGTITVPAIALPFTCNYRVSPIPSDCCTRVASDGGMVRVLKYRNIDLTSQFLLFAY